MARSRLAPERRRGRRPTGALPAGFQGRAGLVLIRWRWGGIRRFRGGKWRHLLHQRGLMPLVGALAATQRASRAQKRLVELETGATGWTGYDHSIKLPPDGDRLCRLLWLYGLARTKARSQTGRSCEARGGPIPARVSDWRFVSFVARAERMSESIRTRAAPLCLVWFMVLTFLAAPGPTMRATSEPPH